VAVINPHTPKRVAVINPQPWFWTITAMERPPSVYNKGYSATREQAMVDFKARWLAHYFTRI
jgi:hypothetical protein